MKSETSKNSLCAIVLPPDRAAAHDRAIACGPQRLPRRGEAAWRLDRARPGA
jgi:hypothetical protein